jgi:hypothetical protein
LTKIAGLEYAYSTSYNYTFTAGARLTVYIEGISTGAASKPNVTLFGAFE